MLFGRFWGDLGSFWALLRAVFGLGRAKLSGASSGFPWPIVHALFCCCLVLFGRGLGEVWKDFERSGGYLGHFWDSLGCLLVLGCILVVFVACDCF